MAAYDPAGLPDMSEDVPATNGNGNGDYSYDQVDASDDDDDYDPSFGFDAAPADSTEQAIKTEPAAPAQDAKPKTVGGFIMEESDEEDEQQDTSMGEAAAVPPPSQLNRAEGAHSGLGAAAVSNVAGEDVPLASDEPTQDSAAVALQPHADTLNGSAADSAIALLPILHPDQSAAAVSATATATATSAPLTAQQDEGKQALLSPQAAGAPGATSVSATPKPAVNGVSAPANTNAAVPATPTTQRLPHDVVGRLEDRIKDDPKADVNAWWELIHHYRTKGQLDNARRVFDRMLEIWPTSPPIYLQYLALEHSDFDANRSRIEVLFNTALPNVPSLPLWTDYLSHLRRILPLTPDPQGENRAIITSAFDAVLDAVGIDPDSTNIWREYVDFVKSGPGVLGGNGWQDLQKVDQVRKAYQRAVKVPSGGVVGMWKEYDQFEMIQNKANGRKILQEMSPHYMTARTAEKQVLNLTDRLDRRSVPGLPPVEGCEGDDAFAAQVQKWRAWVEWEKGDPLVLKEEDVAAYRRRILFAFKQACMFLRFWPRIWYEAAEWCFEQLGDDTTIKQGEVLLDDGLKANPESVLLTLKKADRAEEAMQIGNVGDDITIENGRKLELIFEPCHKALYDLHKRMSERRDKDVAEVKEYFASLPPEEEDAEQAGKDDDDEEAADSPTDSQPAAAISKPQTRTEQLQTRIKTLQDTTKAQQKDLSKTISYLWIAKMRAFRRIQAQGAPNKPKKGFRGVFSEARPRGQLTADVYVANALMEWHCYKDGSALKIFERGLKLFPVDEGFALEYMRHLISVGDLTNARVVFETTVSKILGKVGEGEGRREKVRPLLLFMHEFEAEFGDLAQVRKLEGRMRELYPEESELGRFAGRYAMQGFDGLGVQLVLSPSQIRPKMSSFTAAAGGNGVPMIAAPGAGMGMRNTPPEGLRLGPNGPYIASPKRPHNDLEDDTDNDTPRKFMRADSPSKGFGSRRATQGQGQGQGQGHSASASVSGTITTSIGAGGFMTKNFVPNTSPMAAGQEAPAPASRQMGSGPTPLPNQVSLLLQVLPNAVAYAPSVVFDPNRMVNLLRGVDIEGQRGRILGMAQGGSR